VPPSAKLTGLPNGYPAIEACVEIVDIVPQVMLRTIQRQYAAWSPTAGTGTPASRGLPGAWHVTRPASARSRVEVVPAMLLSNTSGATDLAQKLAHTCSAELARF